MSVVVQKYNIAARMAQYRQKHQLIMADVSLVQNLRDGIFTEQIDDPLELIIQPAHELDVGIFQHTLCLACPLHRSKKIIHGHRHIFPLVRIHPRKPFL